MTEIVTELVVDSGPAVAGVEAYIVSMDLAADATDKMVAQTQKVDAAIAKQIGPVTQSTERLGAYRSAWDRLVSSADPAARAHATYERAVKTAENATRRGITTNEEAARTLDQLQRKLLGIGDTPVPASPELPALGNQAGLAAHQMQNLSFQMQDVGQAVLTGQPIFRTLVQQGSQMVQIFGPGTGVIGAVKGAGTALLQFVTNPLNLAVLGFAAAAAGAQALIGWLFGSADAAEEAESATDILASTVDRLRDAYGEARVKVEELTDAERIRLALLTETQLQDAQRERSGLLGDVITGPAGRERLNALFPDPGNTENGLAMKAAIDAFISSVRAGNAEAVPFREELERIMFAAEEPALDDLATMLLELVTPLATNEALIAELSDALTILTDAESEAAEVARVNFGIQTRLGAAMETLADSTRDSGRANDAAGASAARSAVRMLEMRRALDTVREGYIDAGWAAGNAVAAFLATVDFAALPTEQLRTMNVAFQDMQRALVAGQPDMIAFREAIASAANLDPENAALQAFVDTLLELTAEAAGLQVLVEGAAPIKALAEAAATAKPPIDGTTRALEQLKDAAAGGIDQAMAKSLYQVALAAAETKEEIVALQRAWAALPFNVGTAPVDIGTANIIKEKTERERLAAAAGGGSSAETASAFDQATEAIERQIRALEIDAATFGLTADAAALFRLEMQLLAAALEDGIVSDAERAAMAELLGQFQAAQAALADLNATAADGTAWQAAKGYAESFATSLVSGLMQGKSALEAVEGSLRSFSQTMMQSAVKDLFAGNFGAGIIKGVVGLIAGLIARRIAERRELAEAQEAWRDMSDELAGFAARLAGGSTGTLSAAIADATAEMQPFIDAAKKAKESTADLDRMLADYARRISTEFMARFGLMIDAFESGLGSNSPAVAAAQNVATVGEELRGFVDDARVATETLRLNGSAVREAEAATQAYALSLLRTPAALSEVETEMLRIEGTAAALGDVLVSLGMSSAEAAEAISAGVDAALGDLRQKFTADLRAKINEALGRGYINEVTDLVGEAAQLLEDAAALGLSGTDVSVYFAAQAQAIVDGADLTGEAFAELIALFPQLAGVVTEASGSVEEAMERINDAAAGVLDYVRGLLTGSSSTLSPEARLANARAAYDAQIALAQSGDVGAQAKITDFADALLDAARTMFASSAGYQDIFSQVTGQLLGLPAVQQTTDPASVALRESLGGMGGGPSALSITPSAAVTLGVSTPAALTPPAANDPGGWRQGFVDLMQVNQGIGNAQIVEARAGNDRIVQRLEAIERTLSVQRDQPRRAGGRRGRP